MKSTASVTFRRSHVVSLTASRTALALACAMALLSAACGSSGGGAPATTKDSGGSGSDAVSATDAAGATDSATSSETGGDDSGSSSEGGPPASCDPIAQTGCTAPTNKCTAVDDGTGTNKVVTGCMKPGTAAVGASCTRASETPAGVGDDTCAPGAYCSGIGTLTSPPTRHCRKFCVADGDCGTGEKCSVLLKGAIGTKEYGICVPTCTLLGTDCTGGMDCSVLISDTDGKAMYATCRAVGTGAADSTCKAPTDCSKGLDCADPTSSGTSTCLTLCDATHACPTGKTCKTTGLPNGGGLCQ